MIAIKITPAAFEYDVQSLVQAFYPGKDFQVNKEETEAEKRISVRFQGNEIQVVMEEQGQCVQKEIRKLSVDCLEETHRREVKNQLKKMLYGMFVKDTGKELPWGNLTGIRPAKIPALLLEEGKTEEEI